MARRGRAILVVCVLLNLLVPLVPMEAGAAWAGSAGRAAPAVASAEVAPSSNEYRESISAARTEGADRAFAPPAPQSVGTAPQNWSPYAPSTFTWDFIDLQPRFDSIAVGSLPMLLVNQSGTVTLRLNGTWNPAPATATDRDWALMVVVTNGRSSARTIDTSAPTPLVLSAPQVPARLYFGLPSPVGFASPTSTMYLDATLPSGNGTRINLTVGSSGLNLAARKYIAPVSTASVWFNASGAYDPGDILLGGQNLTLFVPANGLRAVAVSSGQVVHWMGPGNFPGARAALVATVIPAGGPQGNQTLMMWTRGSPESGLFLNASAAPANVSRGGELTIAGTVGNRTLTASSNWTVNTTAVLPPNHMRDNCTNLLRLQNGSWRLLCSFEDVDANLSAVGGIASAFSADGRTWAWEPGVRHQVCGGGHPIDQGSIMRLINGSLRYYYTGREDPIACGGGNAATHLSSALSNDEGLTWILENEDFGDISSFLVAPTAAGFTRLYFLNASGIQSGYYNTVEGAMDGVDLSMDFPRTLYLLTDGSYKMYYGTNAVYSRTSTNGLNWTPAVLEVANWSGDVEAGPLLDSGDGSLRMLLYSEGSGLFLATLNATGASATVSAAGLTSAGASFAAAPVDSSAADGSFEVNATLPPGGSVGGYRVSASVWFGRVGLAGSIVNRAPLFAGPPTLAAVEDVELVVDLARWATDPDVVDTVTINATAAYGNFSGTNLTLNFPEGVLTGAIIGTISDGIDTVAFQVNVTISPVNDPPRFEPQARYLILEDNVGVIDLTGTYDDVDTPTAGLQLSTNLPGATINGSVVSVSFNREGNFSASFTVSDGNLSVEVTVVIEVTPVDDAPVLDLPALFWGEEDVVLVLDFGPPLLLDEDTNVSVIVLTTDLPGATVSGLQVQLVRSVPGDEGFNVTVFDGTTYVTRPSTLRIVPANDPPRWLATPSASPVEDVPLSVNLTPFVADEDQAGDELSFSSDSTYASVNGSLLTFLYPEGVRSDDVTLTVSDGVVSAAVTLHVAVTPVNDLPDLTGEPPVDLQANSTVTFQFGVQDAELPLSVSFHVTGPPWITISPAGLLSISPPASTHGHYEYEVSVVDGEGGVRSRTFVVGIGNRAPTIGSIPRNATTDEWYVARLEVTDPDDDPLNVSMVAQDPSIVFDPETYQIRWMPIYPHAPPPPAFELEVDITFRAFDGIAETFRTFTILVRDPADRPPQIIANFAPIEGRPNQTQVIDLGASMGDYAYDPDDLTENLTWQIAGGLPGAVATWSFDPTTQVLTITFREPGVGHLTLLVEDPSGRTSNATFLEVRTIGPPVAPPLTDPAESPWWWWLLLAAAAVGVAGTAFVARRRMAQAASLAKLTPLGAAGPSQKATYLVEDVLLLSRGGRPIYTRGAPGPDEDTDRDVVASMLVAVQEFVKDAFRAGGPVSQMSYGDNAILLERGDHVILAVNVYGTAPPAFRELMDDVVGKVERALAGVIGTWDGDRATLTGLDELLAPLWVGSAGLTRDDVVAPSHRVDVQMLSAIEFFQGYVRVRVAVVNNTESVINGAIVDIDYNADVLRLARIEPATYKAAGARVILGSVGRGEKVSVAYYLDPQLCSTSWFDGSCVYKDVTGKQHVLEMKSRQAEIICPLFFTREQANSALLKRLIETDLKTYDARGYRFKRGASHTELHELFEAMKSAVLAHDVQLVRTFEKRQPFFAEAWFYGRTQVKGRQMVIRAAVNTTKGRAEFFVASTAMPTVTGLLAELHHTFQLAAAEGLPEMAVEPLFDEQLKREYSDSAAVARSVDGEEGAQRDRPE